MHSNCIRSSKNKINQKHFIDGQLIKQCVTKNQFNQIFKLIICLFLICIQSTVICLENRPKSTSFISDQLGELVEHGPQHIPSSKNDQVYVNSFHVHLHDHHKENGDHVAKRLAKRHGFTNLGKVSNFKIFFFNFLILSSSKLVFFLKYYSRQLKKVNFLAGSYEFFFFFFCEFIKIYF